MSNALYRLGRFAARRPWMVIGAWLVVSVAVIAASGAFGRELEAEGSVPGLDSQEAVDLLSAAESDTAGLTAQLVMTPLDDNVTFFESADAQAALSEVQVGVAALPSVLGTSDPAGALAAGPEAAVRSGSVSPDGRIVLIRIQYPVIEELSPGDLENLKEFGVEARDGSPLQIEMGGDLFSSFEEPSTGSEMIGLIAAVIILLLAFGSLIAMGLPLGMSLFGLALGISAMSLITYLVDIPSFAPQMASMIGLAVGIDYALFLVTRYREFLARGMTIEEIGRPRGRDCRSGCGLRRRHRRHRDPRFGRCRRSVHDRCRHRHIGHRPDHGGRLGHPATRVPGSCRALDQPPRTPTEQSEGWPHGGLGLAALG